LKSTTTTDETDETEKQSSTPRKKAIPTAFIPKNKKTAGGRELQKTDNLDRRRKRYETSKHPTIIIYDLRKGVTAYDRYGWRCWGTDVISNTKSKSAGMENTAVSGEFTDNGVLACAYATGILGIDTRDGRVAWKKDALWKEYSFNSAAKNYDETERPILVFQNGEYALILTELQIRHPYTQREVDGKRIVEGGDIKLQGRARALRLADGKECWNASEFEKVLALTENYAILSKNGGRTVETVSLKTGKETKTVDLGKDPPAAFYAKGNTIAYAPAPAVVDVKAPARICLLDESGKTPGTTITEKRGGGIIKSLSISNNSELLATVTQYRDEKTGKATDDYVITVYSKKGKNYSPAWNKQTSDPVVALKFDPETEHLIAKTPHFNDKSCSFETDVITSYDPCKGDRQWVHECRTRYVMEDDVVDPLNWERINRQTMTPSYDGLIYIGDHDRGVCVLDTSNGELIEQIRIEPAVNNNKLQYTPTKIKSIAVRRNYR